MPQIDPLPDLLEQKLETAVEEEDLEAIIATDLDLDGRFNEEWLVVTPRMLQVYAANGTGYEVRDEFALEELTSVETDGLVGGGALLATIDGQRVEVVRYSNGLQRTFSRVARFVNDLKKYAESKDKAERGEKDERGEPITVPEERPRFESDEEDQRKCPNCGLILPSGTSVCPSCMSKGKAIRRMLVYLKPHKREVIAVWVMMMVGIGFSLIPTYLTQPLTDKVLNPVGAPLPLDERFRLLGWLAVILLVVRFSGQALGIWRGRIAARLGETVSHELRNEVFGHLQHLSLNYFDKRSAGSLIARVTRDTDSLRTVLVDSVQNFFSNVFLFFGIGIVLFWMNWKLTLLVFIPAPIVVLLSRFFWNRMKNVWRRSWHFRSYLTATVSDSLSGIRVVRAFAKEDFESHRFDTQSSTLFDAIIKARYMWITFFPVIFFIMNIGSLIVWYVGGYQVIEDSTIGQAVMPDREVFTLGQFFVFLGYLGQFYGPLQFMSRITDYLSRSLAAAERVFEVLDTEIDIQDADNPVPMPEIRGEVEFRNVTFGYEFHKPVLRDISFKVAPGEMIGLVGKSGAGKSTTINLICRFYEVQEGAILIDGVDIKDIAQNDLRSQIGVVLQEPFLFSGSIYENIVFARPDARREDVMAAARAANAHGFIIKKPDGYDTQVGERGQTLSGGERQRISIARAILHNPRILILDEATASVDTDTESQIQEAIARLIRGRTTFAIAHRLSTLRNATRLVVLKNGRVAEMGTHEELIEAEGEFHRLVKMQEEMNKIIEVA